MNFDPRPVTLTGRIVRLEPLQPEHAPALWEAGRDPAVHRYLIGAPYGGLDDVRRMIVGALEAQRTGAEVAWATVRLADGAIVGTTRYLDIRRPHRSLEIGHTWITPAAQRTAVNTEAKLLQLRHAFEELGAVRVQLKTDKRNEASRRAIARLGAVEEGILRNYQTRFDGYVRDTVMFSLTAAEWPEARRRLEERLLR